MNHILPIFLVFAFCACSSKSDIRSESEELAVETEQSNQQEPVEQLTIAVIDSIPEQIVEQSNSEEVQVEEEDCIFNNDFYGLTTEWIDELKIETPSRWNDKQDRAEILIIGDSIYLRRGGCYHSGNYAEIVFLKDTTSSSNFDYWKNKAINFAIDYGFEHSAKMLENDQFTREWDGGSYWLDIEDDDPDDITYYSGFEFNFKDGRKSISLDRYVN